MVTDLITQPKENKMRKLSAAVCVLSAAVLCQTAIQAKDIVPQPYNSSNFEKVFPLQYQSWIASKNDSKTEDYIAKYPFLAILRAGTGGDTGPRLLGLRGHYYAWVDVATIPDSGIPNGKKNEATTARCNVCHSSIGPEVIRKEGERELQSNNLSHFAYMGAHSVGCINCHDPESMKLKVSHSFLDKMLTKAGKPTFEKAGAAEQKSLVCAQCHYTGYTVEEKWKDKTGKIRTATVGKTAWKNGFSLAEQEAFLNDGKNFPDGKPFAELIHPISKTPIIWSIHPDYELFKTGIHGKMGLSCTSCHMPKVKAKDGTVYTNHNIGNPMNTFKDSCGSCHSVKDEAKYQAIVKQMKDRAEDLRWKSGTLLAKAHLEAGKAWEVGATEKEMKPVLQNIRASYWRFNSLNRGAYFHNPQETLGEFANSIRYAEEARVQLRKILAKHGAANYVAPKFDTKEQAMALLKLPNRAAATKAKCRSIEVDSARWVVPSTKNGTYDKNYVAPDAVETWYTRECRKPVKG